MAKDKKLNPADAYRKALRKKEVKKNKADRSKARQLATVKTDTSVFEAEIAELEAKDDKSAKDAARLGDLRNEVSRINKKKEEFVEKNPEQRKMVYRGPRHGDQNAAQSSSLKPAKNYFDKNGMPVHPKRSIYYDAVFNPFGVPPPGMPYIERPPMPGEVYSDQEDVEGDPNNDEDEDDIIMPEGPPPDDDDDIPLPEGPPPSALSSEFDSARNQLPPPLPPPLPQSAPAPYSHHTIYSPAMHLPPPPPLPTYGIPALPHITRPAGPTVNPRPAANLPPKPPAMTSATAVISAEPELRDLKKESTSFMPSSLRKKKAPLAKVEPTPSAKIGENAVRNTDPKPFDRPNLAETLRAQLSRKVRV